MKEFEVRAIADMAEAIARAYSASKGLVRAGLIEDAIQACLSLVETPEPVTPPPAPPIEPAPPLSPPTPVGKFSNPYAIAPILISKTTYYQLDALANSLGIIQDPLEIVDSDDTIMHKREVYTDIVGFNTLKAFATIPATDVAKIEVWLKSQTPKRVA